MPVGYLITVVGWGIPTLFAVAPMRGRVRLGWVSFFLGVALNEVPSVAFYFVVVSTALLIAQGGLHGPGAWVAFGIGTLDMAALIAISVRARTAGAIVGRALNDGLGPDWRRALDPAEAAGLRAFFAAGLVSFVPLRARRPEVEHIANIAYGDAGVRNLLDVYRHRSRPSGCPVLVHLHGGGLRTGRKDREALSLIYRLASRGWVCVSANYRLSPAATFPDHLVDVKKVIAWVRAHGEEFGADPSVVFVAGGSAGAQLASLAALTPNEPRYQPGFESADTSVTAAIALYGLYSPASYGSQDVGGDAFPMTHLRSDAPPFFVAHGDRDTLLRVETAREFAARLRSVSRRPVVYAELSWAQHTFDRFRSVRCDNVVNGIEAFADWVLATRGRDRG
jgi:acetyl esterase/lipase